MCQPQFARLSRRSREDLRSGCRTVASRGAASAALRPQVGVDKHSALRLIFLTNRYISPTISPHRGVLGWNYWRVQAGVLSRGSVACNQVDEYTRIDLIRDWVLQFAEVLLVPDTGACENISARGRCFANTAVWCGANDELIATPCGVEQCGWSGFVNGFRCVKDDPCHGIDDFGLCRDATTLLSCDDGHVAQTHCACAQRCVVSSSDGSAYCSSDQLKR